jgi:hypothetical protein
LVTVVVARTVVVSTLTVLLVEVVVVVARTVVVSTLTVLIVEVVVVADKKAEPVVVDVSPLHVDVQIDSELQYAEEEPHQPHFERQ